MRFEMRFEDSPIVTWRRRPVLWPTKCVITEKTMPMFTKAYLRRRDYLCHDDIVEEFDWISPEGYTLLTLQDKLNE